MSAPRFFVERLAEGERCTLTEEDSRHALRSLRLRPGDAVGLSDGRGAVAQARLVGEEGGGRAVVEATDVRLVERPSPLLSVAMAPPKGDRLSWAIQKLGEVGADEVILVESERAVRRWEGERGDRIRRRLGAVAREAAMQSRRPFVMGVTGPRTLPEILQGGPQVVVLWEGGGAPLAGLLRPDASEIRLVVGPEGGFAEAEIEAARTAGADLASLGEGILRTETAALAASVLALSRLGRLG